MPPGTRRAGRGGYADHDDFEGLPVRQWRQEWVNVAPPVPQDQHQQNDIWAVELLHGMPKDSHLLPPYTQELLRAARSGQLYKIPPPVDDNEADPEADLTEKPEKKEEEAGDKGFSIRVWKQIPKNVEATSISHLAKRRKGTVTISSRTPDDKVQGPTITRATVKRIDAAGNPYTEEVTLADGQQVVGEIISTRIEPLTGPRVEIVTAAPPPQRRKPPPPKRKKAGPGRGRKRIKLPMPGRADDSAVGDGTGLGVSNETGPEGQDGFQAQGSETPIQDTEMGDVDEDDEDDDHGDDGDEGEEGDEGEYPGYTTQAGEDKSNATGRQDHDMPDVTTNNVAKVMDDIDMDTSGEDISSNRLAPPNPVTLPPPVGSIAAGSPKIEGSPLKNVLVSSPVRVPALDHADPVEPRSETEAETMTESLVAEPPSTIAGEALNEPAEPNLSHIDTGTGQPLLPPPPDQVGNIATPKTEDALGGGVASFIGESNKSVQQESAYGNDAEPQRPLLFHRDSVMTEDSIKPDDSASVRLEATGSGTQYEVGISNNEPESLKEDVVQEGQRISLDKELTSAGDHHDEADQIGAKQSIPEAESELASQTHGLHAELSRTTSAPDLDAVVDERKPPDTLAPPIEHPLPSSINDVTSRITEQSSPIPGLQTNSHPAIDSLPAKVSVEQVPSTLTDTAIPALPEASDSQEAVPTVPSTEETSTESLDHGVAALPGSPSNASLATGSIDDETLTGKIPSTNEAGQEKPIDETPVVHEEANSEAKPTES